MPKRCKCGKFLGKDVCHMVLDADDEGRVTKAICAACWHQRQMRHLVGPLHGAKVFACEFLAALRTLRPSFRWLKPTFVICVAA